MNTEHSPMVSQADVDAVQAALNEDARPEWKVAIATPVGN